ncbi:glycosyl hydrolase [Aspergillus falconensis]
MPQPVKFQNPVIPGFNPDPCIVRVGKDYFLVTSTFEYFPGIPIYHSTDLLNWTLIGPVLVRRSQLDMRTTEPSGGVWAPTIRYVEYQGKGRFYISVGCTQRFRPKEWDIVIPRGFYVTTDNIWAKDSWSDPIYSDVPGIDQDLCISRQQPVPGATEMDLYLPPRPGHRGGAPYLPTPTSHSPTGSPVQHLRTSWRDDLHAPNLKLGWYHLRTPLKREYSLTDNPGSLSVHGNAYRIADAECPSMLLQNQPAVSVDWRVGLRLAPANALEEAGTAIWWSQFAYASIGLRMSGGGDGHELFFRGYTGEGDRFDEKVHPIQGNTSLELLIRARPAKYELLFSVAGSGTCAGAGFTKLGEIISSALTVRHPGRESANTGAHFAIYVQGVHGMPCLQPAVFSFAEWECV